MARCPLCVLGVSRGCENHTREDWAWLGKMMDDPRMEDIRATAEERLLENERLRWALQNDPHVKKSEALEDLQHALMVGDEDLRRDAEARLESTPDA